VRNLFLIIAAIFLSISTCAAAPVSEVPGDGLDDSLFTGGSQIAPIGSCPVGYMDAVYAIDQFSTPAGCDRKCAAPDEDCDGYNKPTGGVCTIGSAGSPNCDSNDHDRREIPLDYYPCDAGGGPGSGYHLAQSDGSYGSCVSNSVTPLCEATGGGVCKYVRFDTGSDSNPGTYASPYKTLGKVSGGAAGAPGGAVTLATGSVVYVISGTTTAADAFSNKIGDFINSGITVEGYPGGNALFNIINSDGLSFADNGTIVALAFMGACTGTSLSPATPVKQFSHNGFEARRNIFEHLSLNTFNNNSAIYLNSTNTSQIHHNLFYDWKQGSGGCNNFGTGENANALKWLDDANAGQGANHRADFNVFIEPSPIDITQGGSPIFYKHGVLALDAGTGTEIDHNFFVNTGMAAIDWESSKLRAHDNLSTGIQPFIRIVPDGTAHEDNQLYNNTILGTLGSWVPKYTTTTEKLSWHHNIIYDYHLSYNAGNNEGVLNIDSYGNSSGRLQLNSNNGGTGSLFAHDNCYFNPNLPPNWAYFATTGGGGNYNFAQWKTLTGPITVPAGPQQTDLVGSFVEDPLFTAFLQATSLDCSDKGAFLIAPIPPVSAPAVAAGMRTRLRLLK
jgi:hypothetical protein